MISRRSSARLQRFPLTSDVKESARMNWQLVAAGLLFYAAGVGAFTGREPDYFHSVATRPTPRSVNRRDGAGRRRQGGCGRCTFDFPIADYTATAGWRPRPPFALLGLG